MELALTVQRKVLPKYGFPGTLAGVEAMRKAICPFLVDWMVRKVVDEMDKIIGLPRTSTENAAKGLRSTCDALSSVESDTPKSTLSCPDDNMSDFGLDPLEHTSTESVPSESKSTIGSKPCSIDLIHKYQDYSLSKAQVLVAPADAQGKMPGAPAEN